ncbi:hypothetical protein AVEN_142523-1 [Araneus ventricosus]|uniref:Uncharacterized protein n=1 Tax=Araneus ventricosus TaxID=182803 RepID=A0A4Y2CFT8_ARAVE|nr:hypothetical protein AVEN_142523-1 [Araneus ventricosus]
MQLTIFVSLSDRSRATNFLGEWQCAHADKNCLRKDMREDFTDKTLFWTSMWQLGYVNPQKRKSRTVIPIPEGILLQIPFDPTPEQV